MLIVCLNVYSRKVKDKLIQAALKEATNHGIHNLSMGVLAKKSKIAVGNFYYHFNSKQELLDHVYVFCRKSMGQALVLSKKESKSNYKKQFDSYVYRLYRHFHLNPRHLKFIDDAETGDAISIEARLFGDSEFQPIKEFIQKGISGNKVRSINPDLALQLMLHSVAALLRMEQQTKTPLKADIEDAISYAWRGLRQKKGAKK